MTDIEKRLTLQTAKMRLDQQKRIDAIKQGIEQGWDKDILLTGLDLLAEALSMTQEDINKVMDAK